MHWRCRVCLCLNKQLGATQNAPGQEGGGVVCVCFFCSPLSLGDRCVTWRSRGAHRSSCSLCPVMRLCAWDGSGGLVPRVVIFQCRVPPERQLGCIINCPLWLSRNITAQKLWGGGGWEHDRRHFELRDFPGDWPGELLRHRWGLDSVSPSSD